MGISLGSPSPKAIIDQYIVGLPQFPDGVRTGDEVYEWYRQQAHFEEISVFNDIRLQRKFKEVAETPEECAYLNTKATEINRLSQQLFDKKFAASAL